MAKKFKDYYDQDCAQLLAQKLSAVYSDFDSQGFVLFITECVSDLEFTQRQDLFAEAFEIYLTPDYSKNIEIFTKILGPKLQKPEGMFIEGWWLWPVGRYVQRHGLADYEASIHFIYELTQRFTGEFAIRPLLEKYPEKTLHVLQTWAQDTNVHVRRLSSEGMRISLPWAQKLMVVLDHFEAYKKVLYILKADPEKFVQKSVGNNLNDLMKVDPEKAFEIIHEWERQNPDKATLWILKHGQRSLKKEGLM